MKDELNQALSQPTQDEGSANNSISKDPSDALTPDHPRFKEVIEERNKAKEEALKEKEARLALEERLKQLENSPQDEDDLSEEQRAAIDKIKKTLLKEGIFATKEDISNNLQVEKRSITHDRLSMKFNGENGLPKYNAIEVTEFAKRNGYGDNYESAYKALHQDAIIQVEAKRLGSRDNAVVESEPPTKGVRPTSGRLSTEEVRNMDLGDWEQTRNDVLTKIKQAAIRASQTSY